MQLVIRHAISLPKQDLSGASYENGAGEVAGSDERGEICLYTICDLMVGNNLRSGQTAKQEYTCKLRNSESSH
jgi:hypothetical protein